MISADLAWSWVRAANSFAAVAGILAALTISAIVLVLSKPPEPSGQDADSETLAARPLFYAFLVALYSLVAAAMLFADITGEVKDGPRSYFTGTFAGTLMALAVMQLLLAIIWSAAEYIPNMPLRGAHALFVAVAVLAGMLMLVDQTDFFSATSAAGVSALDAYPLLGWAGVLFLVVLPLGFGLVVRQLTWRRHLKDSREIRGAAIRLHDVALCLTAGVTTLLTGAVSLLRAEIPSNITTAYTPLASVAIMALVGLCVFFFTWSLPFQRHTVVESGEGAARGQAAASSNRDAGASRIEPITVPTRATARGGQTS